MTAIDNKLKELLGDRYATGDIQEVSKFFRKNVTAANLTVAYPQTHEEIHEIVPLVVFIPRFAGYSGLRPLEDLREKKSLFYGYL